MEEWELRIGLGRTAVVKPGASSRRLPLQDCTSRSGETETSGFE